MIDHETAALFIAATTIISLVLTIASILILRIKPEPLSLTVNEETEVKLTVYSHYIEAAEFEGVLYFKEEKSGYWLKETALTPAEKQLVSHLPVNKVSKKPI